MKNLIDRNKLDKNLNKNKFSLLDLIIWVCLTFSLSLVMLLICSTTANAQTTVGCTDPLAENYNPSVMISNPAHCVFFDSNEINFFGFNTTAIASIMTPTISTFNVKKLIVKYKEVGTNGWTTIKLKIDEETFNHSGRIDTLGVSFWYFHTKVGSGTNCVSHGNRYHAFVRLNNLNTDTNYKVKMRFKGQSLIGGSNKTTMRSATDNTKSFMYEAPYTTNNPVYN
tara:strand:- start:725 stop:1399 length:675 start_codon:yes stop_codon:yes gene_type:complete